jgi:signal transduction histidine kinase
MKAANASLNRRLIAGAAIFITAALLIAAIIIGFVLHRFIQGQIDQRLDTHLVFLSSMLTADADGTIALAGNADGPPFDRPARGWYWQINGPKNVLRSRSLDGNGIDAPPVPRRLPPPDFRQMREDIDDLPPEARPAPGDGPGPGHAPLHFRIVQQTVGSTPVTLIASSPRAAVMGPLRAAMITLGISLAILGLALMLAIVFQVRLGLQPLERLRRAVTDVRAGRSESLPAEQPREIQPLVTELNGLLEHNAANLERARRHVANLAHGLKTPLATLSIALAERGHDGDGELHGLAVLMERRIRHHLARARAAAMNGLARTRTPVALRLEDICNALRKIYADKNILLTLTVSDDLSVACEQQDFDEMAGNLLDNAFRWARSNVAVNVQPSEDRMLRLMIDDDGPGLRPEQIPQVLSPGGRADESAPGFGFGLPIVVELAELYGGDLILSASSLGGLRVTLRLPWSASRSLQ